MGGRAPSYAFTRQFLAPLLVVISTTLIALFAIFSMMVLQQNELATERERSQISEALADKVDFVSRNLRDYSRWSDAVDHLAATFDAEWANANVGPYLYNLQGYDHTLVVDPDGRTIYASEGASQSNKTAQDILGGNLKPVLDRLNRAPLGREDRFASLVDIGGRPTIVAASAILPSVGATYKKPYARRYIILSHRLDDSGLSAIARSYQVSNLHFERFGASQIVTSRGGGTTEGTDIILRSDLTAAPVARIRWDGSHPGNDVWYAYLPWLIAVAINAIVLSVVMLLKARSATRDLAASEATARHMANHDTLTGLPNRRALLAHGAQLASSDDPLALLYLDLDGFKEVNDLFGHQAGDVLLTEATVRLQKQVGTSGMLARVGGDEFAILISGTDCHAEAPKLAARIVETLSEPFTASHIRMVVSGSVGIALGMPNDSVDELARLADIAMYVAKADGRNCWRLFEKQMSEGREIRALLESELRVAIKNREIDVMFQPIVRADDSSVCSLEALARWTSPTQGPVGPAVFVSIAEECGLIVPLGEQVLRRACEAAAKWDIDISVNMSPAQFWHQTLVPEILAILKETGFPANRLELEIAEGYLVSRPELAAKVIDDLREQNIRIALDDFGTGFASIGYLRRFSIDRIKLDRSFVKTVHQDHEEAAVVHAVIALSQAMRLPMTAEGVESKAQAALLRTAGCERLQGWEFGRPMSVADAGELIAAQRRPARARA